MIQSRDEITNAVKNLGKNFNGTFVDGIETLRIGQEALRETLEASNKAREEEAAERERMYQRLEDQRQTEILKREEREFLTRSVQKIERSLEELKASGFKTSSLQGPVEVSDVTVDLSSRFSALSADDEVRQFQIEALAEKEAENCKLKQEIRRLGLDNKDLSDQNRAMTLPIRDLSNLRSSEQPLSKSTKKSADSHAVRIRSSTRIRKQRENSTPFKYF